MGGLAELRIEVERLATEAGRQARGLREGCERELKQDGSIVTAADRDLEAYLRKELSALLPRSSVWGEEQGWAEPGDDGLWLVDPIDGTSNFAFGSPLWGVSIGLLRGPDLVLGVVCLPDLDELYSAHKGGGATCNGQELERIPPGPILNEELLSCSDGMMRLAGRGVLPGRARYSGAFVVDATFVARQRFRGLIGNKGRLYDIAACVRICQELDADVRYADGEPMRFEELADGNRIPRPYVFFPRNSGFYLDRA